MKMPRSVGEYKSVVKTLPMVALPHVRHDLKSQSKVTPPAPQISSTLIINCLLFYAQVAEE